MSTGAFSNQPFNQGGRERVLTSGMEHFCSSTKTSVDYGNDALWGQRLSLQNVILLGFELLESRLSHFP